MNNETRKFWDAVKLHLSGNGLYEVMGLFPEVAREAGMLMNFEPERVQMGRQADCRLVTGATIVFTGDESRYPGLSRGQEVRVAKTPMTVLFGGGICVETPAGVIYTVTKTDIRHLR
ncbi:MAG: hypothetical protein WCW14_01455 [Candidatus Paceibacterota bacterium]|jgi:hypothetical protein